MTTTTGMGAFNVVEEWAGWHFDAQFNRDKKRVSASRLFSSLDWQSAECRLQPAGGRPTHSESLTRRPEACTPSRGLNSPEDIQHSAYT